MAIPCVTKLQRTLRWIPVLSFHFITPKPYGRWSAGVGIPWNPKSLILPYCKVISPQSKAYNILLKGSLLNLYWFVFWWTSYLEWQSAFPINVLCSIIEFDESKHTWYYPIFELILGTRSTWLLKLKQPLFNCSSLPKGKLGFPLG